ncbi:MAG: cupin [Chloroflexi bacterium AL-W]|nr:cupin [Chloroflexi bacterium AL-N1]NOK71293.1 cupin [Chloroflexi bacterium AL-N10]NOK77668.1 cupin [Chloroflexi bacterium AL-N5]NOK84519.1 cupin [Chloroflexi bacterium AL-W]NOK92970.1 cupin [Chloroflexi bacterium AL-N15]
MTPIPNGSATVILDVQASIEIPPRGILSRTIYEDDQIKVILFGFDTGQALSEHTAARPAIIHIIQGEAQVTLGTNSIAARAGTWIHMPPHLPHSVQAKTPTTMQLVLLPQLAESM